jgi:hypothetical protein
MLQADANFLAANAKAVKTPVFKMSFADDPGANEFININPVEDPDPVVDPVHGVVNGLVAVGSDGTLQTSDDGVTWAKLEIPGVNAGSTVSYVSMVSGMLLVCFTAGDLLHGQVFQIPLGGDTASELFSDQLVLYRFVEFGGEIFYANYRNDYSSNPGNMALNYASSLAGPWHQVPGMVDQPAAKLNTVATANAILTNDGSYNFKRSTDGRTFTIINSSANISGTLRGWLTDTATGAIIAVVKDGTRAYILTSADDGASFVNQGYAFWSSESSINNANMTTGNGRLIIIEGSNSWVWNINIADLLAGSASFTHPTNLYGDDIRCVCFAEHLGLFVAAGDNGRLITSPDGLTWTTRTVDGFSGQFTFVWGGEG